MAVIIYLLTLLAIFLASLAFQRWRRKRSNIPGPTRLPFFGLCFQLAGMTSKDVLPILRKFKDEYGGICKIEVLGIVYYILSEPETVEPVLNSSIHITKGTREYSFLRTWLNDGLLLSNGAKWQSRRKLLTPSFHFKILETSLGNFFRNADSYVAALLATGGKPVELEKIIQSLTLNIICETAMGVRLNAEDKLQNDYTTAINYAVDGIVHRYMRIWLYPDFIYLLSKAGKIYFKSINILHKFSKQVINKRKALFQDRKMGLQDEEQNKKVERKAFLDLLLDLDNLNPADIQEEVDTFMFEGHDTVSSALTFSHFLLANHPNAQDKAFNEQKEIFGNDTRMPTTQDLQKMEYLEMVIKETLRLYPSVPFHTRLLTKDLEIDENTVIPSGDTVGILTYLVHRSKKHWNDPDEFIPERFAPRIERHPFSFIPFSAGSRNCIGQKFAMMEMKTVLSSVLRKCKLVAVTTSVTPEAVVILKSVEPIILKIFPREY